jgi:hypothetical protein
MSLSDWVGFTGVSILLMAFLLNLLGKVTQGSLWYAWLNFIGAGLACLASVLIDYVPFIILEASWTLVSLAGIIRAMTTGKRN